MTWNDPKMEMGKREGKVRRKGGGVGGKGNFPFSAKSLGKEIKLNGTSYTPELNLHIPIKYRHKIKLTPHISCGIPFTASLK